MKPEKKLQIYILSYCILLWVTNFSISHSYDRETGLTAESTDMRGLGALIGLVVSIMLARRVWRLIRKFLDLSIRVPTELKLWGNWSILLLLLPLAFGYKHNILGTADDGAAIHTVIEFGGGASSFSIVFSAMSIMLLQIFWRLKWIDNESN